MIELNLLSQEYRKKKKKIEIPELPLIPIAAIFVAAMVVIQLILSGFIFLGKRQIASLDNTWKELAPQKVELDKIKRRISNLTNKTTAIERLMATQLRWAQLLNELSNSLTSNIWLNEMSYSEKMERTLATQPQDFSIEKGAPAIKTKPAAIDYKMRTLTLSGSASGRGEEATTHIAHFIRALKENNNFFREFDDIELVSIKKVILAEQDIMDFILVCRFKPQKN